MHKSLNGVASWVQKARTVHSRSHSTDFFFILDND